MNPTRMPEAEVSLRLAFYLLRHGMVTGDVYVAIDGAQVRTSDVIHFALADFLQEHRWQKDAAAVVWQGTYAHADHPHRVVIHSNPGRGDVTAELRTGQTLRVECKKGPLTRSASSQEYPLLREALGQLLTIETIGEHDLLGVAVPHSP